MEESVRPGISAGATKSSESTAKIAAASAVGFLAARRSSTARAVGVVSSWALERHARSDVRTARLEGDPNERCLYLVLRRDDTLGPAATTFVAHTREQAQV